MIHRTLVAAREGQTGIVKVHLGNVRDQLEVMLLQTRKLPRKVSLVLAADPRAARPAEVVNLDHGQVAVFLRLAPEEKRQQLRRKRLLVVVWKLMQSGEAQMER